MMIGTLQKGEKTELRVMLNDARSVVDLRQFDRYTSTGLYTVTKIGLPVSVADLDALIELLQVAKAAAMEGQA